MTTRELLKSQKGHYVCIDCKTEYPINNTGFGLALCNGHKIDECPWCRPDSAPWKNGRGI